MKVFTEPPRDCDRCPRLHKFLQDLRISYPDYHNAPVPSFGDPNPQLLIVGLAPGMHGANRTGRPFTGDESGALLFATLAEYGFLQGAYEGRMDDNCVLSGAQITNAVRCLPPGNKPTGAETRACRSFLEDQINSLGNLRAILTLGRIAHDNSVRALGLRLRDYPFGHHRMYEVSRRRLFSSYHCSRYNVNTRRLTKDMFFRLFEDIRDFLQP